MYITNGKENPLGSPSSKNKETDLLNSDLINSMGHIVVIDHKDSRYDVETICVETGLLRFDVCGMIQRGEILDFSYVLGDDGIKRDVDDLFLEQ